MLRREIHLTNPNPRTIVEASELLQDGKLLVYPTDTVYGVGCSLRNKSAIEKLYSYKGKERSAPMTLLCSSISQASEYAKISNDAYRIMKRCSPGPFTFILNAAKSIPRLMLTRRKEIGVRVPDSEICFALIESLENPILNASTEDAIVGAWDHEFDPSDSNRIGMMLDAGPLEEPGESTIVSLISGEIEILREGKGDIELLY